MSGTAFPVLATMTSPRIVLIAAVAENNVIGQGGTLPWRLRSEMRFFRERTWGKPIVVGRKTYESFQRQPLPGRTNIVVSRDGSLALAGAVVAPSLAAALDVARADALRRGVDEIMVAGGADLYAQTLPIADRLVITRVKLRPAGDATFPPIDPEAWQEVERIDRQAGAEDDTDFAIHLLERRRTA